MGGLKEDLLPIRTSNVILGEEPYPVPQFPWLQMCVGAVAWPI